MLNTPLLRDGEVHPPPKKEMSPFGITTTIVNPGFFRTELLTERSTNYAERGLSTSLAFD